MSVRSGNYSHDEDKLLCKAYKQISQDPVTGRYQSSDEFWDRVHERYHATKKSTWETRSHRSLQGRIQVIEKAVRKFHGCIRAVEGAYHSGISHEDVMDRAKELFEKDPRYKKGWRFHHVWETIGDFEKFRCAKGSKKKARTNHSSASENQTPDSQDSEGMPSFSMNLGDDDDDDNGFNNDENNDIGGSSSSRPIGMKKAKNKAYNDETTKSLVEKIRADNQNLMEMMKSSNELLNQQMEKKNAFKEMKEENKILFQDSSLIQDPRYRAFVQAEQARILHKRAQQSSQPDPTASYPSYFNNFGGSSSDIPEY